MLQLRTAPSAITLAIMTAALAIGCGGRQTPPPPDVIDDPVVLFEAMLTRLEGIDAVRVRATLEYYGSGGRVRVRQVLLAKAPEHLRIDTISPFDTTLSTFMIADGRMIVFDLQERTYTTASATPENIARFVPFPMSAADLVRVLFGGPPLDAADPDPDAMELRWDRRAGAYRLTLPLRAGGVLEVDVQHGTWVVSGARQDRGGRRPAFELRAGRFETFGTEEPGATMPTRLRFLVHSERLDVTLDIERLDLNVELQDALFSLPPPAGVEVIELR